MSLAEICQDPKQRLIEKQRAGGRAIKPPELLAPNVPSIDSGASIGRGDSNGS